MKNNPRYYVFTARCHGKVRKIATAIIKNNSLIFTPTLKADSFMAVKGNIKCHVERVYFGKNGDNNLTLNYAISGFTASTVKKNLAVKLATADIMILISKKISGEILA